MSTCDNGCATKVLCNGKRGNGNTAANSRNKYLRTRRYARARDQHSVRREMREPNGGGFGGIVLLNVKDVGYRSGEKFRVGARRVLANHVNVFARGIVIWSVGRSLQNSGHENDASTKPCGVHANTKFDNFAHAIGTANRWPLSVNTRHATTNPKIQVIQRGNFGLNLHFASQWLRLGAIEDKVHIGGDGGCLFGNFNSSHEQSVTMARAQDADELNRIGRSLEILYEDRYGSNLNLSKA